MKTKFLFLISLFANINIVASAQKIDLDIRYSTTPAENNTICYTPGNKLIIDDFKGKPDEDNRAIAITSSGFSFKAGFRSTGTKATLSITVFCNFDKSLSWMKENGKNAYILNHEQHHFDISYLTALEFIKKMKQQNFTEGNYKEKLRTVYNISMQEMETLQHKYDEETQHGQSKQIQTAWDKKIEDRLIFLTAK